MDRTWSILLELDPVAKGRPRFGKGFTYTPKKTKEFEKSAQALMRKQFWMQPLEGPIRMAIVFNFPRPAKPKDKSWHIVRPDLDNLIKAVSDAGNGILYSDDSQVCELYACKKYVDQGRSPHISLTISVIDAAK
jgi:Holliday junction resolvase RusA-like endonuclease